MKPLDLKRLQIDYPIKRDGENKVRVKREMTSPFLRGPIPLLWLQAAGKLPGKALHIGISLWFLAGVKTSNVVKFNLSRQTLYGVKRDAARRGLNALANAGLISISRSTGKCQQVTIHTSIGQVKEIPTLPESKIIFTKNLVIGGDGK